MTPLSLAVIIQLAPDAPLWLSTAAAFALVLHVGGGSLGVLAGAAALALPKGAPGHRTAGTVFFISMLTMAAMAAVTAPFTTQPGNVVGAVFTFYLVGTGWLAVRRRNRIVGAIDFAAVVVPIVTAVISLMSGLQAASSPGGTLGGVPSPAMFVTAGVATLAAGSDLRVIWRGGVGGAERLARHLWRLCVGLLIALGSALTQPRLIPAALSGSPVLVLPALAVAAVMIWWLVRVRFPNAINPLQPARNVAAALLNRRRPTWGRRISPVTTRIAAPR
jgi:hypothetical protein